MAHSSSGIAGANFDRRTTDIELKLGTVALGNDGTAYTYCRASGAVATGVRTLSTAFSLTTAAGSHTADTAFADGEYGWVRRTTSPF